MTIRKRTFVTYILLVFGGISLDGCAPKTPNGWDEEKGLQGLISVSGAFALYPLVIVWAEEFKEIHPNVRFNISAGGAGKGVADALSGMVDIGLVSREIHQQEYERDAYVIHVAKDAVVGTISSNNPNLDKILSRGLTQRELNEIFVVGRIDTWDKIDAQFENRDLHLYTRSDAAGAAETWAAFFDRSQEDLKGVGIFGDPGMAQTIKNDALAIGFNNINYVYDLKTRKLTPGIAVIPIDLNNDGSIDEDERFYDSIDELTAAVATGKYPAPPARNLSFLFKGKPDNLALIEFVKFVLTKESQSILPENGYIPLNELWVDEELAKLN